MDEHPTTKQKIVDAALATLKEEGFAGTSARAIARRGGFNQALIFYHFGTLNDLLLEALDQTSASRMERYSAELKSAHSPAEKMEAAASLYREDLASGHITVLSEMIAGSLSRPDLGPEILARMRPWIEFAREMLAEGLKQTAMEQFIDPHALAVAMVALYLGVDLISHLGDHAEVQELFQLAERLAPVISMLGG